MDEHVPAHAVTAAAQRPNRMDGTCFYCGQFIGALHKPECVLICKRVRVRLTIEYDVEVPAFWDAENVEFHRNESSWCADNLLDELKELAERKGCLCSADPHFDFVETASGPFRKES